LDSIDHFRGLLLFKYAYYFTEIQQVNLFLNTPK